MIDPNETFNGTFPYKPHFTTAGGFKMHYVDEGHGSPILEVIPALSKNHRVIVPDYMGFGKSDTPQDREYTARCHTDNIELLVKELNLQDITLVLHDWGGQIGGALALRQHQRISRIVVMNTLLSLGMPEEVECLEKNGKESAWFRWANRAVADGTFESVLRNAGVGIVGLMKLLQGFERRNIDETFFRAYSLPFAEPSECNGVIAFPKSIVTGSFKAETGSVYSTKAVLSKPAIMIEGMRDKVLLPRYFIPLFKAQFPNSPIYQLENASHFCLEDAPEEISKLVLEFIESS
ncbi:putative Alpha/beta hydrolase [Xylogone sp. PMI_703]|nr:putative Alpha/beta hydrolase [Xylogone sp. PMI_703]